MVMGHVPLDIWHSDSGWSLEGATVAEKAAQLRVPCLQLNLDSIKAAVPKMVNGLEVIELVRPTTSEDEAAKLEPRRARIGGGLAVANSKIPSKETGRASSSGTSEATQSLGKHLPN